MLVRSGDARVLLDVTRDFDEQAAGIDGELSMVLVTHAHRDAFGGLARLSAWARARGKVVPVLAHPEVVSVARARWRRLSGCRFVPVAPGGTRSLAPWRATPCLVPHAADPRFPTYAWRLEHRGIRVVYASDVAELRPSLQVLAEPSRVLVIDGAMWGRRLYSHLTIDRELPRLCAWRVDAILITQIGRTAPPHARLERLVAALCPRARPAHDGMVVRL